MASSADVNIDTQKLTRDKLADQLAKRHRERQQQLNVKHQANEQNLAVNESFDYFQQTFREHVAAIEESIAKLKPGNRTQLAQDINKICEAIQNLQSYLTASTFFLPNYTIKAYQQTVNELKTRIESAKDKLLTKKKFGFRSKVESTPKVSNNDSVDSVPSQSTRPAESSHRIDWTVQNQKNQEIVLTAAETNDKDITISTVDSCLIIIFGHPGSLQLSALTNCVILCGPIARSLFADNCTNCKFAFGCQQLRLHSSQHCDLYMHVTSRAIIEDCNHINVAPFNYTYDNIDDDFVKAGLDLNKNNWENVADFNWLSTDVKSPNWNPIAIDERITNWIEHSNGFRHKILSN